MIETIIGVFLFVGICVGLYYLSNNIGIFWVVIVLYTIGLYELCHLFFGNDLKIDTKFLDVYILISWVGLAAAIWVIILNYFFPKGVATTTQVATQVGGAIQKMLKNLRK